MCISNYVYNFHLFELIWLTCQIVSSLKSVLQVCYRIEGAFLQNFGCANIDLTINAAASFSAPKMFFCIQQSVS